MITKHMAKADPAIVAVLTLEALSGFNRELVKNRGVVCGQTLEKFVTTAGRSIVGAALRGVQNPQQLY